MCGLVAVVSPKVQTLSENKIFKDMLVMDQLRGKDSVGVYGVNTRGDVLYTKSCAHPSDFLQLKAVTSIISNASVLVGHNRHATLGAVNSNNAHPFQHDTVTLVHNGTLDKYPAMKRQNDFDTDSECVAWNISQCKNTSELVQFLESLSGAFAFIWYDTRDDSLYYVRNSERTLYTCTVDGSKIISSERGIMFAALDRNNVDCTLEVLAEVPVGVLFKVKTVEGNLVTSARKLTLKTKTSHYGVSTYNNSGGYNYLGNVNSGGSTDTYGKTYSANPLVEETGILPNSWHSGRVTQVTPWGVNNDKGTVTVQLIDPDTGCKVVVYNIDISKISVNDLMEVQVTALPTGLYENIHAKMVSDFTLRGCAVRELPVDDVDEAGIPDEDGLVVCSNCAEVMHKDETYDLINGEYICKACYNSDTQVQIYVNSNQR